MIQNTRFSFRTDDTNLRHVRFTVFAQGANCGQLTMTTNEWPVFRDTFLKGAKLPGSNVKVKCYEQGKLL